MYIYIYIYIVCVYIYIYIYTYIYIYIYSRLDQRAAPVHTRSSGFVEFETSSITVSQSRRRGSANLPFRQKTHHLNNSIVYEQHIYIYIYMYICIYTYTYIYLHIILNVYVYIYIYIYSMYIHNGTLRAMQDVHASPRQTALALRGRSRATGLKPLKIIGPADCNHCNCKHIIFSEPSRFQYILAYIGFETMCGYSCSGYSLLVHTRSLSGVDQSLGQKMQDLSRERT